MRSLGIVAVLLWPMFVILVATAPGKDNRAAIPGQCTTQFVMDGAIGLASLDTLERAIEKSVKSGCESTLVLINTPGGSLQTTRKIVEEIMNSPIPILCLVHPTGGHAGSAGAIILQACHVSGAMVATNIGAATPISSTGSEMPEDLRKKIMNDTLSWMEGIVKQRGRNEDFGRDIISEAKAVAAKEAFDIGAIDFVAETKAEFLKFAEGRTVKMAGKKTTEVKVGPLVVMEKGLREKLMELFADPQIAYMMFMASLALLYFEITHPGTIVPGVFGGIGLILSMMSLHKLDVTWGGMALLLLGVGFMIAEAFVPSFGILGLGGVISFILGSLFLFDMETSGYQLPLTLILPVAFTLSAITFGLAFMAFRTRNIRRRGDYNDIVGRPGVVVSVNEGQTKKGLIEIHGETWKVESSESLQKGDEVNVISHRGLTLMVEKQK